MKEASVTTPVSRLPAPSGAATRSFSGRTPSQSRPSLTVDRERGRLTRWPCTSSDRSSPVVPVTEAWIRLLWPRKFAANVVRGIS